MIALIEYISPDGERTATVIRDDSEAGRCWTLECYTGTLNRQMQSLTAHTKMTRAQAKARAWVDRGRKP